MPGVELFWILVVVLFLATGSLDGVIVSQEASLLAIVLLALWFWTR